MHTRSIKARSALGAFATVMLSFAVAPSGAPASSGETGYAAAHDVADAYRREERGYHVFRVDTSTEIRAGLVRRDDANAAVYVFDEGSFLKKRVLMMKENRHVFTDQELAQKSTEPDGAFSRVALRLPYDLAAVNDYTYDAPVSEGTHRTIRFHTKVRDDAHGDGMLDLAAGDVLDRVTFSPAVLPSGASSASITVRFGEVGAGERDIVEIARTFGGRRLFVSGTVVSTSRYSAYRRCPDIAAALAAFAETRA